MKKLYCVGAYFYIEFVESGLIVTDLKSRVAMNVLDGGEYYIAGVQLGIHRFELSELQTKDGTAFSAYTIRQFFNYNTGQELNAFEWIDAVAAGRIDGRLQFDKWGETPNLTTAGFSGRDIWDGSADNYSGFIDAAGELELVSDQSADTNGGTGAQKVIVGNLRDENYNIVPDIEVTMNGTTLVSLGEIDLFRSSRMYVSLAGSGQTNVGTITLRKVSAPAQILGEIQPSKGQTQQFLYTVPTGYTLTITDLIIGMTRSNGSAGSAQIEINGITESENSLRKYRPVQITDAAPYSRSGNSVLVLAPKTDLKVRCVDISDSNTKISAEADGYLTRL